MKERDFFEQAWGMRYSRWMDLACSKAQSRRLLPPGIWHTLLADQRAHKPPQYNCPPSSHEDRNMYLALAVALLAFFYRRPCSRSSSSV